MDELTIAFKIESPPSWLPIGRTAENNWRAVEIDCSYWFNMSADGSVVLMYKPSCGMSPYPLLTERDGDNIVWRPKSGELVEGVGRLQAFFEVGTDVIGSSDMISCEVDSSLLGVDPGTDPGQTDLPWALDIIEQIAELSGHYPKIIDGNLYIWDSTLNDWVEFEASGGAVESVNGKTGTVVLDASDVGALPNTYTAPVQSVNGQTGAVALGAADVHALPDSTVIPPTVTEQTVANWGFTKNTGTYSKPSGGIPKSDLASAVQTSLGKADTALQQHQSLADYAVKSKLPSPHRIINIGHRGALPSEYPENTAPAFAAAAKQGFDYAEFDVRATSDGVLVCLHDATINRVARNADGTTISGGDINIADITYAQAQNYVFCSGLYSAYPTIKICTVEDAIKTCAMCGIGCWFDMYIEPTTTVLDQIFGWLDSFNMRERSVFNSATYNYVAAIKAYDPAIALSTRSSTYSNLEHALSGIGAFDTGKNRIFVNVRQASMPTYAPAFHARGWLVVDSTLNPMSTMVEYASYLDAVLEEDFLFSDEIADYIMENSGQASTPLLNLNRTASQNQSAWYNEAYYLNPAQYSTANLGANACTVSDLTESSITVTEGGSGGTGCAFPLDIAELYGKTLTLSWDATGTSNTRFRLIAYTLNGTGSWRHTLIDNTGTKSQSTIAISADGMTITVDGTAITHTQAFTHIAFFFGSATSTTTAYKNVKLVEEVA